ncbi:glycosyltransferase family 2 protein [Candidatus Woesearchaeota archaeon]|nr:glycosyltransferase family 2 protein [Candidatus Woesearchaeota archaeon]
MNKDVWAVIPAYNESKNIGNVLKEVKKYLKNIVVIDDGSKDNTYEVAKNENVIVLRQIPNKGKGAAMRKGCDYAIENGAQKIILMDSDGQHDPKFIPNFINSLNEVDLVFGVRKFSKKMPLLFRFGNSFLSGSIKVLYGFKLRDTQSGYRAFNSKVYRKIKWKSNDYSVESEMIARAGNNKVKSKEIPISTIYNDKYKGTTPWDGVKIFSNMIKWKVLRLR